MISHFFIDRPIFASVISILITLLGLFALRFLPIEQYPNIAPPMISVSASYPGADALTASQSVAAPLEQQINGVENMIYMYSQSASSGEVSLNVFFDIGTNIDMAQVNVQNRINLAMNLLPEEVTRMGVTVSKQTSGFLLCIALQSEEERYDEIYVSNYASINVIDELLRVPGVSTASIIGARDYSMRIWLMPDRMAELGFTTDDITHAIREQNATFGLGQIGKAPSASPVELTIPVTAKGRFSEVKEFENIILRANLDGSMVLLKDVGRIELGAASYDVMGKLNNKPTTLIVVAQQYGANALDVATRVKEKMQELSKSFPKGLTYSIPYNTTTYIRESIKEVVITLLEAAFLVTVVVYVFLQTARATVIPLLAMIISIVGTFAGMYVLGFSLNTLTLFGLVLAIGIVVDDAIVVIENAERNIRESGKTGYEAAKIAMKEVTGPIIATSIVLCAVFIPVAFLGGIAGQLYKQFAVTIAISVLISAVVALTLSPALTALLLKQNHAPSKMANRFNHHFSNLTDFYSRRAKWLLMHPWIGLGIMITVFLLLGVFNKIIPRSFAPQEDQGYLIVVGELPDGASLDRSAKVDTKITEIGLKQPGVDDVVSFVGYSLLEGLPKPNADCAFLALKDREQRKSPHLQANSILMNLWQKYSAIPEARIFAFNPPSIPGMGVVGGFEFWIENKAGYTFEELEKATRSFIENASKRPELSGLTSSINADNMQLVVELDRYKARSLGVPISSVFNSLQLLLGSLYVNDFMKFGRIFKVTAQAEPSYRSNIDDFGEVYVRSDKGQMIPLKSLIQTKLSKGPNLVSRFNGTMAAKINGNAAAGYSSGEALKAVEEVARAVLPPGMTFAWSGESYQEIASGGSSSSMLLGGMLVVFLILAALYERWSMPLAVLIGIPIGLMGAFASIWLRGLDNDIYFQIGLVTLIALTAKNAILIVEFALLKSAEGMSVMEAALEAFRLRFRAIIMTSLTFILGVTPLVISSGAGAASRHSVGTGVMGGMIIATLLGILLTPLFYKVIVQLTEKKPQHSNRREDL